MNGPVNILFLREDIISLQLASKEMQNKSKMDDTEWTVAWTQGTKEHGPGRDEKGHRK